MKTLLSKKRSAFIVATMMFSAIQILLSNESNAQTICNGGGGGGGLSQPNCTGNKVCMFEFCQLKNCSQGTGDPWNCIRQQYKCVSPNNVQSYLNSGWSLCGSPRLIGAKASENYNSIAIYPNPIFNSTNISFSITQSQKVSLKIFDLNGRLVSTLADKIFEAGENKIVWNAADVNAGIYFLQFQSAENLQTEKIIVTK